MAEHSLPPEALYRFLAGTAGPEERREIGRHLLRGCSSCSAFFRKFLEPLAPSVPTIGPSYDQAFERAQEMVTRGLGELEEPRQMLVELLSHPFPRQEMLVRNHPRYWTAAFCDFLARQSYEMRFSDLSGMQRLARLSVLVGERLRRAPGEEKLSSRVRSWMALGNALRVSGYLNSANRSLLNAQRQLQGGGNDALLLRADLLSHLSVLRYDQRRFDDALALARQDIAIRRDLYSPEDVARSLTRYAMSMGERGRPAEALEILREAETTLRAAESPRLTLIVRHNVIRHYLDVGEPEIAGQLFSEIEPRYEQVEEPLIRTKASWLKAQILSAIGQPADASDLFEAAQRHFLEQGNSLEAAYVGLDWAVVLAHLGRKRELRRLAAASLREFRAHRFQREYLAALVLLRQAY